MKAEEEYKALSDEQRKRQQPDCCSSTERSVCLLAIALPTAQQHELSTYPQQSNGTQLSIQEAQHCAEPDVLGTLDLYAVQSLHGEVLIGMCNRQTLKLSTLWLQCCTANHKSVAHKSDLFILVTVTIPL